ncbi:MAG TPA: trypsin-like serine protease [Candidatus Acidoferrum sp.]|nr:trypsin-like serine protease [Candidatus Acidoferrum sp.]
MRTSALALTRSGRAFRTAALAAGTAAALAGAVPPAEATPWVEPPVVGGSPAESGKWDDAAAVFFDSLPGCSGTLIAPDLVLTAGHCIGGVSAVRLGTVDIRVSGGEVIAVAEEIEYPDSLLTYDLGLLILEHASSFTPRVIASGCVLERYLENGAPVEIVGWGAVDPDGGHVTGLLIEAESVVTDFDCTGGRGCNASVSPNGELGAGGDHVDACFGDSGGPLYLLTDIGQFLVGVTSRGYDDTELPCGEGGIYVRPDAVIDWIEAKSGRTIPRANCNAPPAPTADVTDLEVLAGESVTALVTPNDPDAADAHTYAVADAPRHGEATAGSDGSVRYTARRDYGGMDTFAVEVADNGVPSLSGRVTFNVTVIAGAQAGCACSAADRGLGGTVLVALAVMLPLVRSGRRRRRPRH